MNELITIITVCQYIKNSTMSHSAKDVVLEMVIQLAEKANREHRKVVQQNKDFNDTLTSVFSKLPGDVKDVFNNLLSNETLPF